MNLRQFFTSQNWWGKIIGAILGYLMAGPVGSLIGIFVGNFFDRGLSEHFNRPHWHFHAEKREEVQNKFFEATFRVMGHIAKADGRVSEAEIHMARVLMKEMNLSGAQENLAKLYFNQGKQPSFQLYDTLIDLKNALHGNPELLKLFIDIQYRNAKVDGLTQGKLQALNNILTWLGFAPLNQQYRFYEDFVYRSSQGSTHSSSQQSHHNRPHYQTHSSTLDQAYAILELPNNADKLTVKRAYRRLISLNHPDKLISKGLPEAMIKMANEKTQKIRKAYEQICESKGW